MAEHSLLDCRILVVEDEYLLAEELRRELEDRDAIVIGPFATIDGAMAAILSGTEIDAAVLDVNLAGEMAYPVGDLLLERQIPLVFATGYDTATIPERFKAVKRCEKPIDMVALIRQIGSER